MPILFTLLPLATAGIISLLFSLPELHAQEIERLKNRFEIGDIDGMGELAEPLFAQIVNGEVSDSDSSQKHLIAMAAMKFHLASGDHDQAVLPFLIASHLQTELEGESKDPLVDSVDESFRTKHLPPAFFSEEDRSRFQAQFEKAVENGACLETELSAAYYDAGTDQQSPEQQKIVEAILAVQGNPKPSDREILKLVEHYVTHLQQHPTLVHQSLATAIEGLQALKRDVEADQLLSKFRSQFPDSRRLTR